MSAPWDWLLGKGPHGAWRHVPYGRADLGQGQDPAQEPRVEVIRRLIAYPEGVFARVVAAVAAAGGSQPARWLCYRSPGDSPARPYWLCFVTSRPGGRRFHVGMELTGRGRLGLWFFSGYAPDAVPAPLFAPFPARPDVALPRLELSDAVVELVPVERWIRESYADTLAFVLDPTQSDDHPNNSIEAFSWLDSGALPVDEPEPCTPVTPHVVPPTGAGAISDSILEIPIGDDFLALRFARARLVVGTGDTGTGVTLHPLGRLSTVVGRDLRCDIVLDHPNISHEHLRIVWRNGKPGLEDLGSKNGTSVDGAAAVKGKPILLPAEALIDIGGVPALFVQDDALDVAPGPDGVPRLRHQARLDDLVASERLSEKEAQAALLEARARGITPGEVLLEKNTLTLREWTGSKSAGACGPVLLLLFLTLLVGCHSMGLPPIMEGELEPAPMREGSRRVQWDFDIGFKPLLQARASETPSRVETHFLFPLGLYESDDTHTTLRLYPLFQHTERVDPDGFEDSDTILFPLLFAGDHPVDGGYLYLFPFGGMLKGLLGKDEAVGVLFPLYGWTLDGETERHHLLWPLISLTYGGGVSGFRFLPFFGYSQKYRDDGRLVYERMTILWPFFSWWVDHTNSKFHFESFFLFPLYGQTRGPNIEDTTILWPFFRWTHNKKTDYKEYRVPFPFVIIGDGPDESRFDLWPLFGVRTRGDYSRHFILWPIERYEYQETEEYEDTRLWILPFFWTHYRRYKDGSGEDWKTTVWPLVRYESRRDGFFSVQVLHPLWFTDPLVNFDSILGPFWTLFNFTRDTEGYERLSLLFGLYTSRTTPEGEHRWDVLGGLVGHTSSPRGDVDAPGKTRILWFLEF